MFDELVAGAAGTSGAHAVGAWLRVESAACARRLAGMVAMLDAAYAADGSEEREQWYLDNWGAVSAHIGAAQAMTSHAAANLLAIAVALRDRFPKVAGVFADGLISFQLVRMIVHRGALVVDPDALHALDDALADALRCWEPMSVEKTEQTLDGFVHRFDPHAVIRTQTKARGRSLDVHIEDGSGLAEVYGCLFVHDAVALDKRLDAMARTVCPADPRDKDQLRSDATGALANGNDRLACLCETEDCPAAANPPSSGVVIHLVMHQDTLDGPAGTAETAETAETVAPSGPGDDDPDHQLDETPTAAGAPDSAAEERAALDGYRPLFPTGLRGMTLAEALTPEPGYLSTTRPATLWGGQFVPGAVARRAAVGATIVPIVYPGVAPPEPRYRPSKQLADFVRCRDLTCRFPGCREPATNCDVDHVIPWPFGATQASNLACLCRRHHLLKTFWGGENGWRETQLPTGDIEWTAPDGQRYTTTPGSRLLFPTLSEPTAPVLAQPVPPRAHTSGLKMPRRRSTRAQDRTRRILHERELNRRAAEDCG